MSNYPDNWDSIRKDVYWRDNYTCQSCGAENEELHAHHIIPKSKGGSDDMGNLVTLCKSCHESVHGYSIGGSEEDKDLTIEWILGVILGVSLSIGVPSLAPIGIPMAVISLILLIWEMGDE